jgi:hypothetical protein
MKNNWQTKERIGEYIGKDIYAREFIIKFNLALQELNDEPNALVVVFDSFIPVLNSLAINNNMTFDELVDKLKQYKGLTKQ